LCSNWKPYLYFNPNFNLFLEILKSFQYATRKPNLHRSKTRSKFRILLLLLLFFNLLNPSKNLPEIPQSLIVVLSNSNPCYCQVIIIKRKRKKPTNETKNICCWQQHLVDKLPIMSKHDFEKVHWLRCFNYLIFTSWSLIIWCISNST